ncbi:MAG: hypothetical protein HND58_03755 [Planctomycetota bacterium]|nr:MAG: hypothetical protein HND58_03755 [Planctomycetota bacterium]
MSELVCYIDRAERGMLPVRLRLVSTRVDQSWTFPAVVSDDRAALQRGLRDAANWIAEQLKAQNRSGLGALVLDTDGARSGWIGTHSAEPDTVGMALRQASAPASTDDDGTGLIETPPHVAITPDMQIEGAVSVQPLDAAAGQASHPPAPRHEAPRRRHGHSGRDDPAPARPARRAWDRGRARGLDLARAQRGVRRCCRERL